MITDKKSPYRLVTVEELAELRAREDRRNSARRWRVFQDRSQPVLSSRQEA